MAQWKRSRLTDCPTRWASIAEPVASVGARGRPRSGMGCGDVAAFDSAIRGLEAEIANAGAHLVIDGEARSTYAKLVRGMADDLAGQDDAGGLTWAQAAEQANESRNAIMDVIRQPGSTRRSVGDG